MESLAQPSSAHHFCQVSALPEPPPPQGGSRESGGLGGVFRIRSPRAASQQCVGLPGATRGAHKRKLVARRCEDLQANGTHPVPLRLNPVSPRSRLAPGSWPLGR